MPILVTGSIRFNRFHPPCSWASNPASFESPLFKLPEYRHLYPPPFSVRTLSLSTPTPVNVVLGGVSEGRALWLAEEESRGTLSGWGCSASSMLALRTDMVGLGPLIGDMDVSECACDTLRGRRETLLRMLGTVLTHFLAVLRNGVGSRGRGTTFDGVGEALGSIESARKEGSFESLVVRRSSGMDFEAGGRIAALIVQ